MNELYNRIETLCKEKKLNITQMCKEAGVTRGNLTELKMGRTKNLSPGSLSKIALYFNVSVDYLLTGGEQEKPTAESSEPTDEDYQIIKQFVLDANPDERADVRQYIEFIKSKRK